ncbi:MAG: hypothetical protein FVQ77_06415 [Cytophagales bacterium]|nr:hypothetical protein [Cytophagales bacterium]
MAKEVAKSYTTKTFFIDILTQDIDVKDCIMDLLDNSIDSYKRHEISNRKEIKLTINKNKFEIYDTCGGIEKELLKERVFIFGVDELKREKKSIGLYGIGMKRSIFKIGKKIEIITDDGKYTNTIYIDVDEWKKDKVWDFEINSVKSKPNNKKNYTRISITDLNEEIKLKFDSNVFLDRLKRLIHIVYTRIIEQYVTIYLNGGKIEPFNIEFISDDRYKPARYKEQYGDVSIDIICGIEPKHGRTEAKHSGRRGWNIFTNDRLILVDDTTPATGWEAGKGMLPDYHPIYNDFRGFVFLEADDPSMLPLNTSKNGLNEESKIYNHVLKEMVKTARPVIDHLSTKYKDEKSRSDSLEKSIKDDSEETGKVSLEELGNENIEFVAPIKKAKTTTIINYQKPKELVEKVKRHMKATTNGQVGIESFDYYVKLKEIK